MNPGPFEPGMPIAVISLALGLVRKNLVSFGTFFEPSFGVSIAGILIGVVLECKLPIGTFNIINISLTFEAKDFVIISLRGHRHGVSIGSFGVE